MCLKKEFNSSTLYFWVCTHCWFSLGTFGLNWSMYVFCCLLLKKPRVNTERNEIRVNSQREIIGSWKINELMERDINSDRGVKLLKGSRILERGWIVREMWILQQLNCRRLQSRNPDTEYRKQTLDWKKKVVRCW